MGLKTNHLISVLEEIIRVLDWDGETHWRSWMATVLSRLANSDYSGVEQLLGAYGGMGSFNDLVIGQSIVCGKFSWKPGAEDANDRLSELRGKAFALAQHIKHHHENLKE